MLRKHDNAVKCMMTYYTEECIHIHIQLLLCIIIYCNVSQKRVLPNFSENFDKS